MRALVELGERLVVLAMSRACGIGFTTFHRTTPALSMMKVPVSPRPCSLEDTVRLATSPHAARSPTAVSKLKCSASAQAR